MRYKIVNIRQLRVCDPTPIAQKSRVLNSLDVIPILQAFFESVQNDQEKIVVLPLSTTHHILGLQVVHEGAMCYTVVSIPAILRNVLVSGAEQFICAHNHPSGNPLPSAEDDQVADKLKQATKSCSLNLLDFIIIGDGTGDYYSYLDRGKL